MKEKTNIEEAVLLCLRFILLIKRRRFSFLCIFLPCLIFLILMGYHKSNQFRYLRLIEINEADFGELISKQSIVEKMHTYLIPKHSQEYDSIEKWVPNLKVTDVSSTKMLKIKSEGTKEDAPYIEQYHQDLIASLEHSYKQLWISVFNALSEEISKKTLEKETLLNHSKYLVHQFDQLSKYYEDYANRVKKYKNLIKVMESKHELISSKKSSEFLIQSSIIESKIIEYYGQLHLLEDAAIEQFVKQKNIQRDIEDAKNGVISIDLEMKNLNIKKINLKSIKNISETIREDSPIVSMEIIIFISILISFMASVVISVLVDVYYKNYIDMVNVLKEKDLDS